MSGGWEYDGLPIMLPRLGAHLRVWGSGHVCDSDSPHDGPCVCECGIPAPYDERGTDDEAEAGVGVAGDEAGGGAVLPRAPVPVRAVLRLLALAVLLAARMVFRESYKRTSGV